MLRNRKHLPAYPDGVVGIYEVATELTSFAARRNPRSLDDLSFIVSACYSIEAIRESDYEFAEQKGINAEMKLRVPLCEAIKSQHKALIGKTLYDIYRIDPDRQKGMYLYLSGGRNIDGAA